MLLDRHPDRTFYPRKGHHLTSKSLRVCGSSPFAASTSMTALSAAARVLYVSSEKSYMRGGSMEHRACETIARGVILRVCLAMSYSEALRHFLNSGTIKTNPVQHALEAVSGLFMEKHCTGLSNRG